jgi:hypothetical protein
MTPNIGFLENSDLLQETRRYSPSPPIKKHEFLNELGDFLWR